jgi:hypothetical protein
MADYSECDGSLPFNLDAVHLDLRTVVVRYITKYCAIKMNNPATILSGLPGGAV